MTRNKRQRAGGVFDEWRNMGFKPNPANQHERGIEYMYIRLLTDLAASRFKWTGLPEEINVRYLELTLFYQALAVFYKDGRYDKFMALKANIVGSLNYQNDPTDFNVVGNNFTSVTVSANQASKYGMKTVDNKDVIVDMGQAVPIWANKQRTPDIDVVLLFAKRLANLERTVEINSISARQPKIIKASEAMSLTMSNVNRQIDEGQPTIKVNGTFDLDQISVLDLSIDPLTILNLDIVRDRQWNKCMTLLGIESANQDKKERLVSDEVTANGDQTSMMRFVNLNERRVAAKKINEIYGTKITVEYYTDEERKANMSGDQSDNNDDNDEVEGDQDV